MPYSYALLIILLIINRFCDFGPIVTPSSLQALVEDTFATEGLGKRGEALFAGQAVLVSLAIFTPHVLEDVTTFAGYITLLGGAGLVRALCRAAGGGGGGGLAVQQRCLLSTLTAAQDSCISIMLPQQHELCTIDDLLSSVLMPPSSRALSSSSQPSYHDAVIDLHY